MKIISNRFGFCWPLAGLAALSFVICISAGCNAAQDATRAESVISAVLQIAQAEAPALPASDSAVIAPWVALGISLNTQLNSCISTADSAGGKKSAFLACFNTFSYGLLNATELAQLKVVSPASQKTVQLWVGAISVGLNVAIPLLGGNAQPTPTITQTRGDPRELEALARKMGIDARAYGF